MKIDYLPLSEIVRINEEKMGIKRRWTVEIDYLDIILIAFIIWAVAITYFRFV